MLDSARISRSSATEIMGVPGSDYEFGTQSTLSASSNETANTSNYNENSYYPIRSFENRYVSIIYLNFSTSASFLSPMLPERARDSVLQEFKPKTPLGERLLALRRAYVEKGGELLDAEGLAGELRQRRGGQALAETHLSR
jgi:hypothetical protein